jgi:tetratricopeptide (TPR) repeat protein
LVKAEQRAGDPNAGRLVVIAAAVVSAGALLGYGFVQMRERKEAKALAQGVEVGPHETAMVPVAELVERARAARRQLDTATLVRLEDQLALAAQATTSAPKALEARRERLAVLATLAVESTVRGAALGDARASKQAADYVTSAHQLADQLEPELDPGLKLATSARLALAGGEDVPARYPVVLLPTFRDRELQYVLLAEPLWHSQAALTLDDPARADLIQALEQVPEPTAFERLVLALALEPTDQGKRAQTLVREVLAAAPAQPLAEGLLARLRGDTQVAVADPSPVPVGVPGEDPVPPEPTDVALPQPPEPTDVALPRPPEPTQPKQPKKPGTNPPKPKAAPADMAEEGCKLVHGGKAEQGFSMLQKAFDQDPRDTKVILCMAEGHMKLGRLPSARAMVERVLRSSGKNKKALLLAGKIEDQLGNERSAADYYRKVLEIEPDNATAQAYVDKHG